MLTGGHIAISYLLAESAKSFGIPISNMDTLTIIVAGNITDIDLLIGLFNKKTGEAHHHNISHTPFGVLIIWLIIQFLFQLRFYLSILILISLFIHLILDDVGYWAFRWNIYKHKVPPQVNWFYPFSPFHKISMETDNKIALKNYLFKAWPIALLEILFMVFALSVYILNY